ncbi:MAG TPA: tetratricopeptide repeat protein [Kofleriaceae bacterium]|nr:tetratricopeptide repeat protein [Kofleriaceae bacterium]
MAVDGAFADLRRLAEWFETAPGTPSPRIERLTRRLGALAVPLLGRELRGADPRRRDAARDALASLARGADRDARVRARVIDELRSVAARADDDAKICALGLLAELGEHATARFADPSAMQRRTALALAAQLDTPGDVASAADVMIRQLGGAELEQMIQILVGESPAAARRLADELGARIDLSLEQRERIAGLVESLPLVPAGTLPRRAARQAQVAVLVDAAARLVVVASRKAAGARRWRRWAVLVGASGRIEECLHEELATEPGDTPLIADLCADGYRVASQELEHARAVLTKAARVTAVDPERLTSAYYLGRDLLELGDAHLGDRRRTDPTALALGRAVELLAQGDSARARALLERCDARHPDVAGALAACLLAQGELAGAIEHLTRALAAEPEWPLHHWNLAIALQRQGDLDGCYHALRRFVSTSAAPSGLYADPEQPGRVACAERMLAGLEREARLRGRSLGSLGSRRRARRQRP